MIKGFSRLSKEEKQALILNQIKKQGAFNLFQQSNLADKDMHQLIEQFSENVISIFPFPYSIVPNFLIDNKDYLVPFVTEESSVVAAAAKSAGFWYNHGGFRCEIIGNQKKGHVHFKTSVPAKVLFRKIESWTPQLLTSVEAINQKMASRGGGIQAINLVDKTSQIENYFQIEVGFNTCNAMGANYMNSCLENIAHELTRQMADDKDLRGFTFEVIMSILSNYSPDNAVKVWVECPVEALSEDKLEQGAKAFANRFVEAVEIAQADISRAVTHNKGIFNGIDSVALATGNDWRAIEANGHAYASRSGQYRSLSQAWISDSMFRFEAVFPMQVGTVGGITSLHPLAKLSLEILDNPTAEELMKVMAAAGLASNYAAVRALVTSGIQKGHMKMHLSNLLASLQASNEERQKAEEFFKEKTISYSAVNDFIGELRKSK